MSEAGGITSRGGRCTKHQTQKRHHAIGSNHVVRSSTCTASGPAGAQTVLTSYTSLFTLLLVSLPSAYPLSIAHSNHLRAVQHHAHPEACSDVVVFQRPKAWTTRTRAPWTPRLRHSGSLPPAVCPPCPSHPAHTAPCSLVLVRGITASGHGPPKPERVAR